MKFIVAAGLALLFSITGAGATIYTLTPIPNLDTFITGTITTDGNTGTLSAGDIMSWNINQSSDTVHYQANLNPANSVLTFTGSALSATATQLLFDFGGSTNSLVEFAPSGFPGVFGISFQMCDATGNCTNQVPNTLHSEMLMVFDAPGCCSTSAGAIGTGDVQIGVASVSPGVPEPSTWAMMLLGFAGLGFASRQSRRNVAWPNRPRSGISPTDSRG